MSTLRAVRSVLILIPGKGGSSGDKNNSGSSYKGIIVVWCGNLQQDDNFRGIILNLIGNDLDGNTQCGSEVDGPSTSNVGVYSNNGTSCTCWVYAGGGTPTRAGIILRPGSSADFLPGGSWEIYRPLPSGATPNGVRDPQLAGAVRVALRSALGAGASCGISLLSVCPLPLGCNSDNLYRVNCYKLRSSCILRSSWKRCGATGSLRGEETGTLNGDCRFYRVEALSRCRGGRGAF